MADYKVVPAQESDMREMYVLIRKMLFESPEYRIKGFSAEKTVANLEKYIQEDTRCAYVAKIGNFVVGVFLGYVYEPEMSNDTEAADTILFVEKPWRSEGVGQQLLEAYTRWAQTKEAATIYFGTTTGLTPKATQKLIKNTNYKTVGQVARYS